MNEESSKRIGAHDLGGLPGGAVDRSEHDAAYWERQVDGLVMLMYKKNILEDPAQLRRGIESLSSDVYEKLSYYERWAASAALNAIELELVTQEELDARIADIKSRRKEV